MRGTARLEFDLELGVGGRGAFLVTTIMRMKCGRRPPVVVSFAVAEVGDGVERSKHVAAHHLSLPRRVPTPTS